MPSVVTNPIFGLLLFLWKIHVGRDEAFAPPKTACIAQWLLRREDFCIQRAKHCWRNSRREDFCIQNRNESHSPLPTTARKEFRNCAQEQERFRHQAQKCTIRLNGLACTIHCMWLELHHRVLQRKRVRCVAVYRYVRSDQERPNYEGRNRLRQSRDWRDYHNFRNEAIWRELWKMPSWLNSEPTEFRFKIISQKLRLSSQQKAMSWCYY
jgi:hypothetical protein